MDSDHKLQIRKTKVTSKLMNGEYSLISACFAGS